MKPIALVDADGVLLNFSRSYLAAVESITGSEHDVSEITEWDMHKCPFFVALAEKHLDLQARVETVILQPGFCENIEVLPGAKEGLAALREVADVYVVTAPWPFSTTWAGERTHALWRHFGIPHTHVIVTQTKHLIHGDMMIDDNIKHLTGWKHGVPLLWDSHHNQDVLVPEPIVRVYSWERAVQIAKGLK